MPEPDQTQDVNLKAYLPLMATAYGEAANQDYDTKRRVLSTIFNRAKSGRRDFGAQSGKISDVLNGYYAYSKQSPKYKEALNQKFPDKLSENSFKEIYALTSGIIQGKVPLSDDEFFLTPKEVKTTKMNMSLLQETGRNKTWIFFKYRPEPTAGKRKTSKPRSM